MKKLIIFGVLIVLVFGILIYLTNSGEDNYSYNDVSSEELTDTIQNDSSTLVYFYQTDCVYCQQTSPILLPLADDLGVELYTFNLQDDTNGWDTYKIEGTPTLVKYENGKEIERVYGAHDEEFYKEWLTKNQ